MAKAKKKKYYVVWKGHNPGIYESWDECKRQVSGVEGAQYKAFADREEAETAFKGFYESYKGVDTTKGSGLSKEELELIGKPIIPSISVDAACSGNPGILEYRGVVTKTGEEIFRRGPYHEGTVNIGEFLAIVLGLIILKKQNLTIPIYSDSKTAIKWVKDKKINTKLKRTEKNKKLFEAVDIAVDWLKNNDYSDIPILKWRTDAWGEIPADYGRK